MKERCGTCRHHSKGLGWGCFYSESEETPIMPYRDSPCVFIKSHGKSRWEIDLDRLERENRGKLVIGYETDSSPGIDMIKGEPRKDTGFHDIVRPDQDGNPCTYRVKGNKVYSVEDKYIGKMDEVFPPGPSQEELEETYNRVRTQLQKEFDK